MDIPKLFNDDLPKKFAADPDKFKAIGGKFQINVTGPGGGSWNIDVSSSGPNIEKGTGSSDVTITIAEPDAQKLLESPTANAMNLFFSGKLKVTGNQMLAMKLSALLA
jgi:putative sterol carrier protein